LDGLIEQRGEREVLQGEAGLFGVRLLLVDDETIEDVKYCDVMHNELFIFEGEVMYKSFALHVLCQNEGFVVFKGSLLLEVLVEGVS